MTFSRNTKTLTGQHRATGYVVVRGILGNAERGDEWTDRAEELFLSQNIHAHIYEYDAGALTRRVFQQSRAKAVATILRDCSASEIVAVGHSNGADILLRALRLCPLAVRRLVLIAAACDERFDVNGLNAMLRSGRVESVELWCSRQDQTLATWGERSKLFRFLGLGYGTLGYDGPQNIAPDVQSRVTVRWFPGFDHSDYVNQSHLANTLGMITGTWVSK